VSGVRGMRWPQVKPCGTEAAYRRHLRHREVPCEPCRLAANTASGRYRKTWQNRQAADWPEMTVAADRTGP
jgi:hypothetical protein